MTQTIINLGTGGADLNGTLGGTSAASTDDPTFCDWSGENYLRNFGVGNLASCAVGAWGFTSDFQLDWFGSFDTDNTTVIMFSKALGSGDQRSWWFSRTNSNNLQLVVWPSGTNLPSTSFNSSVVLSTVVNPDENVWLRCTFDKNDGSGNSVTKFFYSFDGATYAQLGADIIAATTSVFNSTANLVLGGIDQSGSLAHSGRGYYWRYQNGIGGTTEFEFDTRRAVTSGSETSWTESSLNGRTVNLFRTTTAGSKRTAVVTYPLWAFSTDDWMLFPDDPRLNIPASGDFTVVVVLRQWNNIVNGGRWVSKQSTSTDEGWRIQNNTTKQESIGIVQDSDGTQVLASGAVVNNGALHVAGFTVDRTANTLQAFDNGSFGAAQNIASVGEIAKATNLVIGRQSTSLPAYPDMELFAVAVYSRKLSATELSAIQAYYENKVA